MIVALPSSTTNVVASPPDSTSLSSLLAFFLLFFSIPNRCYCFEAVPMLGQRAAAYKGFPLFPLFSYLFVVAPGTTLCV